MNEHTEERYLPKSNGLVNGARIFCSWVFHGPNDLTKLCICIYRRVCTPMGCWMNYKIASKVKSNRPSNVEAQLPRISLNPLASVWQVPLINIPAACDVGVLWMVKVTVGWVPWMWRCLGTAGAAQSLHKRWMGLGTSKWPEMRGTVINRLDCIFVRHSLTG